MDTPGPEIVLGRINIEIMFGVRVHLRRAMPLTLGEIMNRNSILSISSLVSSTDLQVEISSVFRSCDICRIEVVRCLRVLLLLPLY